MVMKSTFRPESDTLTIAAGEFKARCLRLMEDANENQHRIAVTKRGRLVGHFVPVSPEEKPFRSVVGMAPDIKILGDIISPLPQEWTLPEWAWTKPEKKSKKGKKKR
jgi:hypothetical protein